jgi:hypothetical protein
MNPGTHGIRQIGESRSDLYAIPATTVLLTVPHRLAGVPQRFEVYLENVSPELGFLPGQVAQFDSSYYFVGIGDIRSWIVSLAADENNWLFVWTGAANIHLANRSTGALGAITNTKWKLRFHAWL